MIIQSQPAAIQRPGATVLNKIALQLVPQLITLVLGAMDADFSGHDEIRVCYLQNCSLTSFAGSASSSQ